MMKKKLPHATPYTILLIFFRFFCKIKRKKMVGGCMTELLHADETITPVSIADEAFSFGITFYEFSAFLVACLGENDPHLCPLCKTKQVFTMETWLCPKCNKDVLYELGYVREDIKIMNKNKFEYLNINGRNIRGRWYE